MYIYMYLLCVYIYIYIYVCVCVCVCVISDPAGSNTQCVSEHIRTHPSFEAKLTDTHSFVY